MNVGRTYNLANLTRTQEWDFELPMNAGTTKFQARIAFGDICLTQLFGDWHLRCTQIRLSEAQGFGVSVKSRE